MMTNQQEIMLSVIDGWVFKSGPNGFKSGINDEELLSLKPVELSTQMADETGRVEGWFRLRFQVEQNLKNTDLFIARDHLLASEISLNGRLVGSFGTLGHSKWTFESWDPINQYAVPIRIDPQGINVLDLHIVYYEDFFTPRDYRLNETTLNTMIKLTGPEYQNFITKSISGYARYTSVWIAVSIIFMAVFWFLFFQNRTEKIFLLIGVLSSLIFLIALSISGPYIWSFDLPMHKLRVLFIGITGALISVVNLIVIEYILTHKISKLSKWILFLLPIASVFAHLTNFSIPFGSINLILWGYFMYLIWIYRKRMSPAQWAVVIGMLLTIISALMYTSLHKISLDAFREYERVVFSAFILSSLIPLLYYVAIRFQELLNEAKEQTQNVIRLSAEKEQLLSDQNKMLEKQVEERTAELQKSLRDLKSTQAQLIHAEKMASLGELTAGIAHEIKNPLNFINNFSDLNQELINEAKAELEAENLTAIAEILDDIKQNSTIIATHGSRADSIIQSMLQHSRNSSGSPESIDLNGMCEEYLRLAYHGLKAKRKDFNADYSTDLEPSISPIEGVPQDIGRVLLNIFSNGFQAIADYAQIQDDHYKPFLKVETHTDGQLITIKIEDNGPGIPEENQDKVFQPFFTTKPTGQGTGLGLSMAYDIIKNHGGEIKLYSKVGEGTKFIINLPISKAMKNN
jgi:signal transduction histidine kinase